MFYCSRDHDSALDRSVQLDYQGQSSIEDFGGCVLVLAVSSRMITAADTSGRPERIEGYRKTPMLPGVAPGQSFSQNASFPQDAEIRF